jgi:hypothetical protein
MSALPAADIYPERLCDCACWAVKAGVRKFVRGKQRHSLRNNGALVMTADRKLKSDIALAEAHRIVIIHVLNRNVDIVSAVG